MAPRIAASGRSLAASTTGRRSTLERGGGRGGRGRRARRSGLPAAVRRRSQNGREGPSRRRAGPREDGRARSSGRPLEARHRAPGVADRRYPAWPPTTGAGILGRGRSSGTVSRRTKGTGLAPRRPRKPGVREGYTLRAIFARGLASGVWAFPKTAKNILISRQRTDQKVPATMPIVNPQGKLAHAPSMLRGAQGPVSLGPAADAGAEGAHRPGDMAVRPRSGAEVHAGGAGNPVSARAARTHAAEAAAVRRAGTGGTTGRRLRR
jgi:hypothetical protein